MQNRAEAPKIVRSLCCEFFEHGVRYFLRDAVLSRTEKAVEFRPSLTFQPGANGGVSLDWMGVNYHVARPKGALSGNECRMLAAVGAVILERYWIITSADSVAELHLFEGLPEDRWVAAFLAQERGNADVLVRAITVLRQSSLITYEGRRISTAVIVRDGVRDTVEGAVPYETTLMSSKRFHRLCDGMRTAFLVNSEGMLIDVVDVEQFARTAAGGRLPAPGAVRYWPHCLATVGGSDICLVLTPNGEIKIFAGGVQTLHFLEGRWHITDLPEKYAEFHDAIGESGLAERLLVTALNLAEARHGALFVVLDNASSAPGLIAAEDLLGNPERNGSTCTHYLLRDRTIAGMKPAILENIAGLDGGVVLDRAGRLLAFGAILRTTGEPMEAQEGGRTTAALYASRFGLALKVSEDGLISFYQRGARVWEI